MGRDGYHGRQFLSEDRAGKLSALTPGGVTGLFLPSYFFSCCALSHSLYPSLTFLSIVKHMTSVPAMGPRSLSSSPGNVLLNLNMAQSSATQAHLADHLSEENRKKEPIFKFAYICIIILWKLHENLTTGKEE